MWGQATIPIVHAINGVANVTYAEIVATISSLSAGPVQGQILMNLQLRQSVELKKLVGLIREGDNYIKPCRATYINERYDLL